MRIEIIIDHPSEGAVAKHRLIVKVDGEVVQISEGTEKVLTKEAVQQLDNALSTAFI